MNTYHFYHNNSPATTEITTTDYDEAVHYLTQLVKHPNEWSFDENLSNEVTN